MSVDDAPNLAPNTCASTRPRTKIHAISHIAPVECGLSGIRTRKRGLTRPIKGWLGADGRRHSCQITHAWRRTLIAAGRFYAGLLVTFGLYSRASVAR